MNRRIKQQIRKAVINGIRRNAERIFDISQQTAQGYVPVNIGNLKRSGIVEDVQGGSKIAYRAPYSADVEFGREEKPITGTQIIHRQAAVRKGYVKRNGTRVGPARVKAYDVTYTNKRLIGFRPKYSNVEYGEKIFRVISKISATKGQYFLARSVKAGIQKLTEDISFHMKRVGE